MGSDHRNSVDIDCLLQDCFLFALDVIHRRHPLPEETCYREGLRLMETLKNTLQQLPLSSDSADHILYATCALLDETVLATGNLAWRHTPLQTSFFHSLNAGTALYDRIRQVLSQPAPDRPVVITFHRVLSLGFKGEYPTPDHPERQQLLAKLAALLPVDTAPLGAPVMVNAFRPRWSPSRLPRWLLLVLIAVAVTALTLGLQFHLHHWLGHSGLSL